VLQNAIAETFFIFTHLQIPIANRKHLSPSALTGSRSLDEK
jgi:hypothetical protein